MITLNEFARKFEALPPEHKRIVVLIAQEYTNQEIFEELSSSDFRFSSVGTIKTTINRICDYFFGELVTGRDRRRELRRLYNEYRLSLHGKDCTVGGSFSGIPQNCLAVYGSLADPDSLRRTLVDHRGPVEYIPAYLGNHTVFWGLPSYRPLVDSSGATVRDLYLEWLVASRSPGSRGSVPVALINVSDGDLDRLSQRERSYELATVTDDIRLADGDPLPDNITKVLTFRSPGRDHPPIPEGYRVAARKGYCDMVTLAFANIHGWGFTLPQPTAIEDVHDADTLGVTTWKDQDVDRIIELDQGLRQELINEGCIRLENSRLPVPIPYVLRPLVNQRGIYEEAWSVSEAAVGLCGQALALVLEDRELQRAAGYNDADIRLAHPTLANNFIGRLDRDRIRPNLPEICRVDLILTNRGDLHVLELNTDSPAGMFNLDVLTPWQLEQCRKMGMQYLPLQAPAPKVCESLMGTLFEHWNGFLKVIGEPDRKLRYAVILDTDVSGRPTSSEFEAFKRLFEGRGIESDILEPEQIAYDAGRLVTIGSAEVDGGKQIDMVYKRLLFDDIMRERINPSNPSRGAGIAALERAYLDNAVCMAPTFLSRMVGNKFLLAIIKHPSFEQRLSDAGLTLTDRERRVREQNIPETYNWADVPLPNRPGFFQEVLDDPMSWVIKGINSYGSRLVRFGSNEDYPPPIFQERFNDQTDRYIVQREVPHGVMEVPAVTGRQVDWVLKPFTLGCYVFRQDGRAKAVATEAKVSSTRPVALNEQGGGRTAVFHAGL